MKKFNIQGCHFQVSGPRFILTSLSLDFRGLPESDCQEDFTLDIQYTKVPEWRGKVTWRFDNCTIVKSEDDVAWVYPQGMIQKKERHYVIYSLDKHFLHEISYLLMLSLAGKRSDQKGYHKIHACGLQLHGINVLLPMKMGGGKSTLLMKMIELTPAKIISDDSPVVSANGTIRSFPLRIGLEGPWPGRAPDGLLKRRKYGKKYLYDVSHFSLCQETDGPILLIKAYRSSKGTGSLRKISKLSLLPNLGLTIVIGWGLPHIKEHYLYNLSPVTLFTIFCKRVGAAFHLLKRAHTYSFDMSEDVEKNCRMLESFLVKWGANNAQLPNG